MKKFWIGFVIAIAVIIIGLCIFFFATPPGRNTSTSGTTHWKRPTKKPTKPKKKLKTLAAV